MKVENFLKKEKMPKFTTKNAIFVYLWTIFQINTLKFFKFEKFMKKEKMPTFGSKNVLFRYFWQRIFKSSIRIGNQHSQICQISKFC